MMRKCCQGLLVMLTATTLVRAADAPFPESMVVLRGQPSVFVVVTQSDVILDSPRTVTLNLPALKADLGTVKAPVQGPFTDADRYWFLIGHNAGKYLTASSEHVRWNFENARCTSGSAFAVSREGIFLTNAHLVDNKPGADLGKENWNLLRPQIAKDVQAFEKVLGETLRPDDELRVISDALLQWNIDHSKLIGAKLRSIEIVLDYKVDPKKQFDALRAKGLAAAFSLTPEEITVPATVLAVGESVPGKDIAVLKATFDPVEQAKLVRISQQRKLAPGTLDIWLADIQNDRIICLPLGNSEDVLPQAKVQAFGMPSNAFNPAMMENETRFKVSARNGQIGQSKRMKGSGGWDAFEMSAAIDRGDSGGPVLDVNGKVIAINMAVANDLSNPLRLVVSINLAKEMLAKAGVTPDPGKLSEHWEQALRLFAEGKYEASLEQLRIVRRIQEGPALSGREASWYVKDMAGRCLQKLGKIPGGK